jgi:hypothetical protein
MLKYLLGLFLFIGSLLSPSLVLAQTPTPPATLTRTLKYYGVDRGYPITESNYKTLQDHAVKTIIVYTMINDSNNPSSAKWANIKSLAAAHDFKYVIWPDQGGDVPNCRWEYPFNEPVNGYYIGRVTGMLDYFASDSRFIGMVSEHEPSSAVSSGCHTTIEDMAAIYTQLKDYMNTKGRTDWKVWNYIDNIASNLKSMSGFKNADIGRIMDVAVTWEHCFGGAEGTCPQAKTKIINDRALINSAGFEGKVELIYLFQTFEAGGGYAMATLSDMQTWPYQFINTNALDGMMYYMWGSWYSSDLQDHPDYWPEMNNVYNYWINKTSGATPTPMPTAVPKMGDVNNDNSVDIIDIGILIDNYNKSPIPNTKADVNSDGSVDIIDIGILIDNYGK